MRFLDKMQRWFGTSVDAINLEGKHERARLRDEFWQHLKIAIASLDTKRILFDSRQAATFAHLGEPPPSHVYSQLLLPYDQFYLEFTESIAFGESIPPRKFVDGMMVEIEEESDEVNNWMHGVMVFKAAYVDVGDEKLFLNPMVLFFTSDVSNGEWTGTGVLDARGFFFDIKTGNVYTQYRTLHDFGEEAEDTHELFHLTEELVESLGLSARRWCQNLFSYSAFFSWVLTYMVAKGVRVVEEPLSRQQRRALERSKLPNPWHVVKVDPTVSKRHLSTGEEPVNHHRFRYDVMGHLRFGRHKLKDGSYRETIEIVRPHQRGLSNELYIPKVTHIKGKEKVNA